MRILFENFKKLAFEIYKNLENKLTASNSFNLLKEKHQSLSRVRQKQITFFIMLCLFCVVMYLPVTHFLSSSSNLKEFKAKQNLSFKLLKIRSKISTPTFHASRKHIKQKIKYIVKKYSLDTFEIKDTRKNIAEHFLYKLQFDIQVKHLNVKQFIRLGTELNALDQSYLVGLKIEENQKHLKHYDVNYTLDSFFLKKTSKKTKKSSKKRKKNIYKKL